MATGSSRQVLESAIAQKKVRKNWRSVYQMTTINPGCYLYEGLEKQINLSDTKDKTSAIKLQSNGFLKQFPCEPEP